MNENHEELLAQAFGDYQPQDPTTGDLDLAERNSFRRVGIEEESASEDLFMVDVIEGFEVFATCRTSRPAPSTTTLRICA